MPLIRRYSRRLGASGLVSMSALSLAAPVFLRGGAALASEPATVGALNAPQTPGLVREERPDNVHLASFDVVAPPTAKAISP
jgi:hypothetical protein